MAVEKLTLLIFMLMWFKETIAVIGDGCEGGDSVRSNIDNFIELEGSN